MKRYVLIIFPLILLLSGCLSAGRGEVLGTGLFNTKVEQLDSDDPLVIQAHYHGRAVMRLIQIGSYGLIAGFVLMFASARFMPESTGLGLGVMAGSGALLASGLFEKSLEQVAYPILVVCGVMAVIALGLRLFQRYLPKKWRKKNDKAINTP